jgi:hypothetical protein
MDKLESAEPHTPFGKHLTRQSALRHGTWPSSLCQRASKLRDFGASLLQQGLALIVPLFRFIPLRGEVLHYLLPFGELRRERGIIRPSQIQFSGAVFGLLFGFRAFLIGQFKVLPQAINLL